MVILMRGHRDFWQLKQIGACELLREAANSHVVGSGRGDLRTPGMVAVC